MSRCSIMLCREKFGRTFTNSGSGESLLSQYWRIWARHVWKLRGAPTSSAEPISRLRRLKGAAGEAKRRGGEEAGKPWRRLISSVRSSLMISCSSIRSLCLQAALWVLLICTPDPCRVPFRRHLRVGRLLSRRKQRVNRRAGIIHVLV